MVVNTVDRRARRRCVDGVTLFAGQVVRLKQGSLPNMGMAQGLVGGELYPRGEKNTVFG